MSIIEAIRGGVASSRPRSDSDPHRPRPASRAMPQPGYQAPTQPPAIGPGGVTGERLPGSPEPVVTGPGGVAEREPARVGGVPLEAAPARRLSPMKTLAPRPNEALRNVPYWQPRIEREAGVPLVGAVTGVDLVDVASRNTGVPSIYARALFQAEGGGNAEARNRTANNPNGSSASGLTQFTEGTWFQVMRDYGARYGLPQALVDQIEQKPNGSWRARTREAHAQLLELRFNPEWSALMAGHYANQEHDALVRRAGRPVTVAEAYLGHFMNGDVGGQWIRAASTRPNMSARALLGEIYRNDPRQAQLIIEQNDSLFTPNATVRDVYTRQTRHIVESGVARQIAHEQAQRGQRYTPAERRARTSQINREFATIWSGGR